MADKIRSQEAVARARQALARSQATREKALTPPVRQWGARSKVQHDQDALDDQLGRYVAGDTRALEDRFEPLETTPVVATDVLPKRQKPKMDMQQQNLNEWFSKSFALHIAPHVEAFNKSNENIKAIFDDLAETLETIDKELASVPKNLENAIARARISVRKGVADDLATGLNAMTREIEVHLIKTMDKKFKVIRAALLKAKASTTDNVTNLNTARK